MRSGLYRHLLDIATCCIKAFVSRLAAWSWCCTNPRWWSRVRASYAYGIFRVCACQGLTVLELLGLTHCPSLPVARSGLSWRLYRFDGTLSSQVRCVHKDTGLSSCPVHLPGTAIVPMSKGFRSLATCFASVFGPCGVCSTAVLQRPRLVLLSQNPDLGSGVLGLL